MSDYLRRAVKGTILRLPVLAPLARKIHSNIAVALALRGEIASIAAVAEELGLGLSETKQQIMAVAHVTDELGLGLSEVNQQMRDVSEELRRLSMATPGMREQLRSFEKAGRDELSAAAESVREEMEAAVRRMREELGAAVGGVREELRYGLSHANQQAIDNFNTLQTAVGNTNRQAVSNFDALQKAISDTLDFIGRIRAEDRSLLSSVQELLSTVQEEIVLLREAATRELRQEVVMLGSAASELGLGLSEANQQIISNFSQTNQQIISNFQIQQASIAEAIQLMGQNRLEDRHIIDEIHNELLSAMVLSRLGASTGLEHRPVRKRPTPRKSIGIREAFRRLEAAAPLNWETFRACFDTGRVSYVALPPGSCSTEHHPQARLFRAFLKPYLRGQVIDVGCGPQAVPYYLEGYPLDRVTGIDPISSQTDHPFQFVSGVGEYLPFEEESFDVVVSGTTLDHYYLLDQGLREAFRVLRRGGHFVAWITEFAGAPAYNPYGSVVQPYDPEHLFHIDRAWFLPLVAEIGFQQVECLHFTLPFNFLFMSFEKPGAPVLRAKKSRPEMVEQ